MKYILGVLIVVFSIPLVKIFNKRIEEVIPISVVEIVLIIYIFGLFEKLKIGFCFIIIITIMQIIGIITYIIINVKNSKIDKIKEEFKNILTPGLLIYVALILGSVILNSGRIFEDYDEFNHWAVIIKNMYEYGNFGIENGVVTFTEYPPFTAVFQYIFLMLKNTYSEDTIIIAQSILYFSIIIPITKNIKRDKNLLKTILLIIGIIFIPMIIKNTFYTDILVDALIGVMLAYTIFNIYREDTNNVFKLISVFSGIIMMSLTKTSGLALAIVAVIIFMFEIIRTKEKNIKNKQIKIFIILFIITLLVILSWYIKVVSSNAQTRWNFNEIIQIDKENFDNKIVIIKNFIKTIFENEIVTERGVTVVSSILILISIDLIIYKNIKENKRKIYKKEFIVIKMITLFYILVLLYMYLTIFSFDEAFTLTSIGRYMETIMLANIILDFYIIYEENISFKMKQFFIILSIIIMFLPINTINEKYINGNNYKAVVKNNRDIMTKIKKYKNVLNTNDKIYFITGISTDDQKMLSLNNYIMMPIKIGNISAGLGSNKELLCEQLLEENYSYIFFYRIPEMTEEQVEMLNGEVLKRDTLYKIEKINSDNLILQEVKIENE